MNVKNGAVQSYNQVFEVNKDNEVCYFTYK
jgi:hypothetical protein